MKPEQREKWEKQREKGALPFILRTGSLWGMGMFVVMALIPLLLGRYETAEDVRFNLLFGAAVWAIGGLLFGFGLWGFLERDYRKALEAERPGR